MGPENEPRFINCHTHIFTGDCVPPLLARTIVPWPFYYLLRLSMFVSIARWWYGNKNSPYKWQFQGWYKKVVRIFYLLKVSLTRYWVLALLKGLVVLVILLCLFHLLFDPLLKPWFVVNKIPVNTASELDGWLSRLGISALTENLLCRILLVLVLVLFFPSGRNLLWFVLRQTNRLLKILPGPQTKALAKRYLNIVRFARYKRQGDIFTKLTSQYPIGSGMIVLPMDMEFMGAGMPPKSYGEQMEELAALKKNRPDKIFPFVFVDPRRETVGGMEFFKYKLVDGEVKLEECFIKDYIEHKGFSGFKIYPALGYYPFDEALLPLWKYAADNGIPIMTHCIRGVIYFRGKKGKGWDFHPVFEQSMGKDVEGQDAEIPATGNTTADASKYEPMLLPQTKAREVQEIFTHPLNYACLLKKEWLAKLVKGAKDPRVRLLFGYNEVTGTITSDLSDLKICFGHFGGEDEWAKFYERDRDNYASQIVTNPGTGINFFADQPELKRGKAEQVWKNADWYSIICSLILQHNNVYADISYILHGELAILPLLKQTLRNNGLRAKVLYGSDFYVVRNHKSDKNMLSDIMGGLDGDEFVQISETNPEVFLTRTKKR